MPPFEPLTPQIAGLLSRADAAVATSEAAVRSAIQDRTGTPGAGTSDVELTFTCVYNFGDSVADNALETVMQSVCEALRTAFEGVAGALNQIFETIRGIVDGLIGRVLDAVRSAIEVIAGQMGQIIDRLINTVDSVVSKLVASIEDVIATVVERTRAMVDAITNRIATLVTQIGDRVSTLIDRVSTEIEGLVSRLADISGEIVDAIGEAIASVVGRIESTVGTILNRIASGIGTALDAIGSAVGFVVDKVGGAIQAFLDAAGEAFDAVAGKFRALIEATVAGAESIGDRIADLVEGIPAAFREVGDAVSDAVQEHVGQPLAALGPALWSALADYFHNVLEEAGTDAARTVDDVLDRIGIPAQVRGRIVDALDGTVPEGQIVVTLIISLLIPNLIGMATQWALAPVGEELTQEVASIVRPTLLPAADTIEALYRGEIDQGQASETLGQLGYSDESINVLVRSGAQLMGVGDALAWWLRGLISEDELDRYMERSRIVPEDRERIKEAAFFIPPVSDLIQFAVREVFSPDIRTQFGLDEGFPDRFAEEAARQGVSDEWARAYWAAHWELPSVNQGFEMLHRKVISSDELGVLLRAKDLMPFWRDRLTAISFRPITRVDVRRMHKLGLLSEEDLQERYEAIGFAPADAEMMVAFTLEYNKGDPAEEAGELAGLTRAVVLNMFEDGIFDRARTVDILVSLDYSPDAADLLVTQREMEIERQERQEQTDLVVDRALAGRITFEQAQDELAALGLEPREIERAIARLRREEAQRNKIPPRAQLDKMLGRELISSEEYIRALQAHGFDRVWSERFLQLAQGG